MLFESQPQWGIVAQLQRAVSAPIVNDRIFGCEEALDQVLTMIGEGQAVTPRVVKNLCSNRAGKARDRRRIAPPATLWTDAPADLVDLFDARRRVARLKATLAVDDFNLLVDLEEHSYDDVALARRTPVGTLKARASRLRARLRATLSTPEAWPRSRAVRPLMYTDTAAITMLAEVPAPRSEST